MTFANGCIFSGGKDGTVFRIGTDFNVEAIAQFDSPVRAIDITTGNKMVVGLRSGSIVERDGSGAEKEVMFSHSDGEVWGLQVNYPTVVTSADDNKVIFWDAQTHKKSNYLNITDRVAGNN